MVRAFEGLIGARQFTAWQLAGTALMQEPTDYLMARRHPAKVSQREEMMAESPRAKTFQNSQQFGNPTVTAYKPLQPQFGNPCDHISGGRDRLLQIKVTNCPKRLSTTCAPFRVWQS